MTPIHMLHQVLALSECCLTKVAAKLSVLSVVSRFVLGNGLVIFPINSFLYYLLVGFPLHDLLANFTPDFGL